MPITKVKYCKQDRLCNHPVLSAYNPVTTIKACEKCQGFEQE